MKILVASYGKTGTKSLAAALRILGYEVYDIWEHMWFHGKEWKKLLTHGGHVEDFRSMYQDVDVAVGVPVYVFWEEIHQAFPQAKVILTVRDEDTWAESMLKHIKRDDEHTWLKVIKTLSPTGWSYHYFTASHQRMVHGYDTCTWWPWKTSVLNETVMRRNYRLHNDYVAHKAPKDLLLIFNISQGWEPLCKFLGKEIPTVAFPYKNKDGAFHQEGIESKHPLYERMRHETILTLSLIAAAGFIAALYFGRNNKLVLSLWQKVKC